MNRRTIAASVVVAVAGGGAVVAASGQARDDAPKAPGVNEGVALIAPDAPNHELSRSVEATLRDAATDPSSSGALRAAASAPARTAVRSVDTSIGEVSVVATDEGVCLASSKAGLSCGPGPARTNLMGGVTAGDAGESTVLFLVHDKIRTVRVNLRGGESVDVPVRANVAARTVASDPVGFEFIDVDGRDVKSLDRAGDPDSR